MFRFSLCVEDISGVLIAWKKLRLQPDVSGELKLPSASCPV